MPATTLVREVMTPNVATLRPDQPIADAADAMASHNYGAMPVVDESGALIGLLRDEDFIVSEARVHVPTYLIILGATIPLPGEMAHVEEELHKVAGSTVGEVMDDDPLTIGPDDTLEELTTRMNDAEVSHVPVVDPGGALVGIVARGDIVRFIAPNHVTAYRPVWAEVDLGAIAQNVHALRAMVEPAAVLAVVKADGYGHGAVPVGRAALDAGAAALGVALVEEGVELRDAGIDATIVVLSEPVADAADEVAERRLTPVVYTARGIDAIAKAVAARGEREPLDVHLKVDTGMHRVGCHPSATLELADQIVAHPELRLAGTCTHFAVADEPDNGYTHEQRARFDVVLDAMRDAGIDPGVVHTCNTAGAIAFPDARDGMVRAGIGIYGISPSHALDGRIELRPALAVKARVSFVKSLPANARVSYGLHYETQAETRVATVPIGYADGVPRRLGLARASTLVHGTRRPIAGAVTMDQLMLDVGDLPVEVGDEVVLLGTQGDERIDAAEWADHVGTIPYEIVCGIGSHVPRRYSR